MMLYIYVQQNQWIVATLLAGIALALLFCLIYQAMWHPRGVEKKAEEIEVTAPPNFFRWLLSFVPWVLILIVLGSAIFTIATVMSKSANPPNW
ncbi:hypothetical protein GMSM_10490 [Geomonas sp. Red276]